MAIDRAERCREWNADHHHQQRAGQARAKQFTPAFQSHAGSCSWLAFMARFRASTGSPQHFPQAAARYVVPAQIRTLTGTLPAPLQQIIHTVWSHGMGWGVDHWLLPPDTPPASPDGSLFAADREPHEWSDFAPGWLVCQTCWLAGICPTCQPDWWEDAVLAHLPQAVCGAHGGMVRDGYYQTPTCSDSPRAESRA
ncbi:MAG: hypothetical protein H0X24_22605 [Ktedonobacterales bacterium]|nr:hypothetical protein [Ktedonobacterales bacterium]